MYRGQKLHHIYHVYADGQWQIPVQEHFIALEESFLLRELDYIGIGIVGTPFNRQIVKNTIPHLLIASKPKFEVIAEEDDGWEQVSLRAMDLSEEAALLYCHTKGAANPAMIQNRWRVSMLNAVVYDWTHCVDGLIDQGLSTMGCFYRPNPWYHYSGNYWWATTEHLRKLPPFNYESRWEAEAWIGKAPGLYGDIGPGHPATDRIERGWTYREGKVKAHSKIFGLRPGRIYNDIEVTRLMQKTSDRGRHITVLESHPAVKTIKITQKDTRTGPPV